MKQVLQRLTSGEIVVEEVPPPALEAGFLRIRNKCSAVSVGTERALIQRVRQGVLGEASRKPERVRQLFESLVTEGLGATWGKVVSRLEQPIPLGYSCAGVVEEVAGDVEGFQPGDPVACAGYGFASHAEVVCVPKKMCVRIPQGVSWEEAAFTTLGSIALHAIRVADVKLGENVAVLGLGIVGQLIAQVAHASGCRVFGIDPRQERVALAQESGAEKGPALSLTQGRGFDAVILAAASEEEDSLLAAAELCRDRGVIVVVGDLPLKVPRDRFYEKELSLRLARSYGPGRYDPGYELHGVDYPYSYVRWTAQRNMEAFLNLLAGGKARVSSVITHRFHIAQAAEAYRLISGEPGSPSCLGVLFTYETSAAPASAPSAEKEETRKSLLPARGKVGIGLIGVGRFAGGQLVPRLRKIPEVDLLGVVTAQGATARTAARRFRIPLATTDYRELLAHPGIQAVVIATPHHLHAEMVLQAIRAGRHLFVEKPLCLNPQELQEISSAYSAQRAPPVLSVGFNRRFSWIAQEVRRHFEKRQGPLTILYRVNAGPAPKEGGWLSDPALSGGRLLGELGHFIDLAGFFVGSTACRVFSSGSTSTLSYPDGSQAVIAYVTDSDRSCPKERIELFAEESAAVVDDFRSVTLHRKGGRVTRRRLFQDKGFQGELASFIQAIRLGEAPPIPFREIFATTQATFKAVESLRKGQPVPLLEEHP